MIELPVYETWLERNGRIETVVTDAPGGLRLVDADDYDKLQAERDRLRKERDTYKHKADQYDTIVREVDPADGGQYRYDVLSAIHRLKRERDRLRDENSRLKVLLSETQSPCFPNVPAWFAETVALILEQGQKDE